MSSAIDQTDIQQVLARYVEIQRQEQELHAEKTCLQKQIAAYMDAHKQKIWLTDIAGEKLKVRAQTSTVIEYDEEQLQRRLGDRYQAILAPDIKKIRRHLKDLTPALSDHLSLVGSPAPDAVRSAIAQGVVTKDEFNGVFKKTTRTMVAVSRVNPPVLE